MTKVVCVGLEFEQIVQGLFVPDTHKHKRRELRGSTTFQRRGLHFKV